MNSKTFPSINLLSSQVVLAFFFVFVATKASLIPTVEVLQGPSSRTTVIGPDGSAVNAAAPGGQVVTGGAAGLVPTGPAILGVVPPIAVRGPAGAILTSHSLAGPAVVPAVAAGIPAVAAGRIAVGVANDPDDNGHQGAYLGDISEAGHDDGSWRGE